MRFKNHKMMAVYLSFLLLWQFVCQAGASTPFKTANLAPTSQIEFLLKHLNEKGNLSPFSLKSSRESLQSLVRKNDLNAVSFRNLFGISQLRRCSVEATDMAEKHNFIDLEISSKSDTTVRGKARFIVFRKKKGAADGTAEPLLLRIGFSVEITPQMNNREIELLIDEQIQRLFQEFLKVRESDKNYEFFASSFGTQSLTVNEELEFVHKSGYTTGMEVLGKQLLDTFGVVTPKAFLDMNTETDQMNGIIMEFMKGKRNLYDFLPEVISKSILDVLSSNPVFSRLIESYSSKNALLEYLANSITQGILEEEGFLNEEFFDHLLMQTEIGLSMYFNDIPKTLKESLLSDSETGIVSVLKTSNLSKDSVLEGILQNLEIYQEDFKELGKLTAIMFVMGNNDFNTENVLIDEQKTSGAKIMPIDFENFGSFLWQYSDFGAINPENLSVNPNFKNLADFLGDNFINIFKKQLKFHPDLLSQVQDWFFKGVWQFFQEMKDQNFHETRLKLEHAITGFSAPLYTRLILRSTAKYDLSKAVPHYAVSIPKEALSKMVTGHLDVIEKATLTFSNYNSFMRYMCCMFRLPNSAAFVNPTSTTKIINKAN